MNNRIEIVRSYFQLDIASWQTFKNQYGKVILVFHKLKDTFITTTKHHERWLMKDEDDDILLQNRGQMTQFAISVRNIIIAKLQECKLLITNKESHLLELHFGECVEEAAALGIGGFLQPRANESGAERVGQLLE